MSFVHRFDGDDGLYLLHILLLPCTGCLSCCLGHSIRMIRMILSPLMYFAILPADCGLMALATATSSNHAMTRRVLKCPCTICSHIVCNLRMRGLGRSASHRDYLSWLWWHWRYRRCPNNRRRSYIHWCAAYG